jgi:hypothetical protein
VGIWKKGIRVGMVPWMKTGWLVEVGEFRWRLKAS